MQYRRFGKLDWKASALGFGAMRLPQLGTDFTSPIDEPEAIKMLRYAFDNGVNYVDTAFMYGLGGSERVVGKALLDGYHQKVKVATKLSFQALKSPQELDRYLDAQLRRLQIEKIDFYLLHGLDRGYWKQACDWKVIPWAEQKIAQGKIEYLGFSFHDNYEVFRQIVDSYDNWAFCQIQYNYMDENNQAGRKGLEYAAGKGLGVIIMEPLRGGNLVNKAPSAIEKIWDTAKQRSRVEWALSWLWNQPEISLVLSGMSTMEQVRQNVIYAGRSRINTLSADDLALFKRVKAAYQDLAPIPCTACQYCQPCPNGVRIPVIFQIYNETFVTQDIRFGLFNYTMTGGLKEEERADKCKECGECVKVCPQKIDIPAQLKKAHEALTKNMNDVKPPESLSEISFE